MKTFAQLTPEEKEKMRIVLEGIVLKKREWDALVDRLYRMFDSPDTYVERCELEEWIEDSVSNEMGISLDDVEAFFEEFGPQ